MKQTVTSKYEPKSKNVTWIDMSSGSPVQKNFINGMWRPTGGGGGAGSSNPTEADATKVWQVTPVQKGTKTEEVVIVPEQTLVDEQVLEYNDKFVLGAQCVAVVNGVEYRGEVEMYKYGYAFEAEFCIFYYFPEQEIFKFDLANELSEVTAKLSVIEETSIYDYNWVPGVKIPVPTAEDEGKILVVTKVTDESSVSTIVPEQPVPADTNTPLTDVDLTKFVVGNTVKVTITYEEEQGGGAKGAESANSQTFTATGVIEEDNGRIFVSFGSIPNIFSILPIDNLLYTDAVNFFDSDATIKLEYIESNYEYQLQENSGGSSNILYCEGSDNGHGLIIAYIDSSELDNPQITTIAVDTGGGSFMYFYRMGGNSWLVGGFVSFSNSSDWVKEWNTEGQYPTIEAYFYNK